MDYRTRFLHYRYIEVWYDVFMRKNKHGEPEYTTWMGIEFRRYPDSPLANLRNYWRANLSLHTLVWLFEHRKPIPPKHHIHHEDRDSLNNAPDNLVAMLAVEHLALGRERKSSPEQLEHLARMRKKAVKWHRSKDGRAWHSEHSRRQIRPLRDKTCVQCAKAFQDKNARQKGNVFCSGICRTRWRYANRLDHETKKCEYCGKEFSSHRFNKTRFCSRACAGHVRRKDPSTTVRLQRKRKRPA